MNPIQGEPAEFLRVCCGEFPSLEVATTQRGNSVLVRLAGPVGVDDLSDEVYTLVALHVADREGVVVTHVVLHDRPAIEVVVTDDAVSRTVIRSVIEELVAEADRLVALWHPDLPDTGA